MNTRLLLVDTDGAADDMVALMMAAKAPGVRLVAVTVVAGTVGVEVAARNVRACLALVGSDAPVVAGARGSLSRGHRDGQGYHGQDGLSDHYALPGPTPQIDEASGYIARLLASERDLTLVTLGPLTNIARALRLAPTSQGAVVRCVVMGGAPDGEGNMTPFAEYNIWADPEAAAQVLRSELPIELIGWKLSRGESALSSNEVSALMASGSELARFAIEANGAARAAYLAESGADGLPLPDAIAMAVALDRTVASRWSEHAVRVEVADEVKAGATILGPSPQSQPLTGEDLPAPAPLVRVCESVDIDRWKALLFESLALR